MSHTLTRCLALAGAVLLAGCHDDLAPASSRFRLMAASWQGRLDTLRTTGDEQERLITSLLDTPGLDPAGPASKGGVSLRASAANDKQGLEVVAVAIQRNNDQVATAFKTGKLAKVNAAISAAENEMTALLGTVTEAAQVRQLEIIDLQTAVDHEFATPKPSGALLLHPPAGPTTTPG